MAFYYYCLVQMLIIPILYIIDFVQLTLSRTICEYLTNMRIVGWKYLYAKLKDKHCAEFDFLDFITAKAAYILLYDLNVCNCLPILVLLYIMLV